MNIDGLPDYRMGESADIEEIEFCLRGGKLNCFDRTAWRTAAF